MKVLFLDFDGVLVTARMLKKQSGRYAEGDPECVAELNRIIAATDAKIVVSSNWRMIHEGLLGAIVEPTASPDISFLLKVLSQWGVRGECIGATPVLDPALSNWRHWTRGQEIASWLASRPTGEVEKFVILDDDRDVGPLGPMLINTELEHGLTARLADHAIRMLL